MFAAPRRTPPTRLLHARLLNSTALLLTAGLLPLAAARAQSVLPTGGRVVSGSVSLGGSGSTLTITQTTNRGIVNFNSYSVGQGNTVQYYQPSSSAATLNRVTGSTPSTIAGTIRANGTVYLVNPNGIAITKTGVVKVGGGFAASSLGIADDDFRHGRYRFSGNGASAAVSNAGRIRAARHGHVALIGGSVENTGTITVPLGKVGIGSGERVTLDLNGDGFMQVAVPTNATTATGKALISLAGKISARGGSVELDAATKAEAVRDAVNVTGVVSAASAYERGGSIVLSGGDGGRVRVSGRLDVSASGRAGHHTADAGSIAVSGRSVSFKSATVSATSAYGHGGSITVTATRAIKLKAARFDASGATGGGAVRIGGDFHGGGTLVHAKSVSIDAKSTITSDATGTGNGGSVVVWSDTSTSFAGTISAKGGAQGGDGGQVEVSSHGVLAYTGSTVLTAAKGTMGTLLLDPYDVVITSGSDSNTSTTSSGNTTTDTPSGTSVISNTTIEQQLSTANVTITTGTAGSAGADAGNITVAAPVTWSAATTLTLTAANAIAINAPITISGAGGLALNAATTTTNVRSAQPLISFGNGASVSYADSSASVVAGQSLSINKTPYTLVYSLAALQSAVAANTSGNFALATSVDGSNGGSGYTAAVVPTLSGTLEGLGNTVTNLKISAINNNDGTAFIRALNSAGTVRDLGLTGVSIVGNTATGGLVGFNSGTITQSYASGTVEGNSSSAQIGGLVGENFGAIMQSYSAGAVNGAGDANGSNYVGGLVGGSGNGGTITQSYSTSAVDGGSAAQYVGGLVGGQGMNGTITQSYATGTVHGFSDVGGLVGQSYGNILLSYATGTVTPHSEYAGGLVGDNESQITQSYATGQVNGYTTAKSVGGLVGINGGTITQSYATGAVSGEGFVGGLVGANGGNYTAPSITQSYATGAVSGYFDKGGLAGANYGTITNGYYDAATTGQSSTEATGLSTAGLASATTLAGLNSNGTAWGNAGNNTTPYLLANSGPVFFATDQSATPTVFTAIVSVAALQAINTNLAGNYVLGKNLDATGVTGFVPIGESTAFTGTFNGFGYTIGNLTISSGASYAGLFGQVGAGGTVSNVGLVGGSVTDTAQNADVGGLAGLNSGSIMQSFVTGAVSGGSGASVGGLAGSNSGGSITQSFAAGAASGASGASVGGLVGTIQSGTIAQSYATGRVSGGTSLGGLVGTVSGGTLTAVAYDTGTTGQSGGSGTPLSTAQLQGTATSTFSFGTGSGFAGGVAGVESGVYPYLTSFYPNGVQAVSGFAYGNAAGTTALASGTAGAVTVTVDAGGSRIGQATTGDNGYYYVAVAAGTLAAGTSLLATTPANGATGATNSAAVVSSTGVAGQQSGLNLYPDTLTIPTASLTLSGAPTASTAAAAAGTDTAAAAVVDATTGIGYLAQGASFTIDQKVITSGAFSVTTAAGAPLIVAAPITITGAPLTLASGGTLAIDALVTAQGAVPVTLTYNTAAATNLSFAQGDALTFANADGSAATAPISGQSLAINGTPYTLLYTLANAGSTKPDNGTSDIAGIDHAGDSGHYALATNLADTNTTFTAALAGSGTSSFGQPIYFTGTFNGLGHTISNLTIDTSASYAGLFGAVGPGGMVANVGLVGGSVSSTATRLADVGGLVGLNNSGTILQSYATTTVSGSGDGYDAVDMSSGGAVGGLIGYNNGAIMQSYAAGMVSGINGAVVGGLVGYADSGTITQSYATGAVRADYAAGGLVGYADGTITQSYATGTVTQTGTGSDTVLGGLVGYADGTTITLSYATGAVSAGSGFIGGLVGDTDSETIKQSYATGAVIGGNAVAGGLVGRNFDEGRITQSYATGAVSGGIAGGLVGQNRDVSTISASAYDQSTAGPVAGIGYDENSSSQAGNIANLSTAALQSTATANPFGTGSGFSGGAAGGENGVYPYLTAFFPNGVQAITGTASRGAQVGFYAGGALLGGSTVSAGANGYVYQAVAIGTLPASGVKIGATVTPAGGTAATGLVYSDAGTVTANVLPLGTIATGVVSETTAKTTYSALQADIAATFGSVTLPTSAGAATSITATNTGGFTLDQAVTAGGSYSVNATGGPLTLSGDLNATGQALTLTAAGSITQAGGTISSGATSITGVGVTLGTGFTTNGTTLLSAGSGTLSVQDVTVNGNAALTLTAKTFSIGGAINDGTGATTINGTTNITLDPGGSATSGTTITDTQLGQITAGSITVASPGAITINNTAGTLDVATSAPLTLSAASGITFGTGTSGFDEQTTVTTSGGNIVFGSGAIGFTGATALSSAANISFGSGGTKVTGNLVLSTASTGSISQNAGPTGALTVTGTLSGGATVGTVSLGGGSGYSNNIAALGAFNTNNHAFTLADAAAGGLTISGNINAGTGTVTLADTGKLTVAAGAAVSGQSPVLAAGGAFVNDAGSAAVTATSGRWLVYSSSPGADTFGPSSGTYLNSGSTALFDQTYASLPPASVGGSNNRYIFANQPQLTVTVADTKTYGQGASAIVPFNMFTGYQGVAGAFATDNASSAMITGAPSITSSGTAASAQVGNYDVTVSTNTLASGAGYGFVADSSDSRLAVTPAALTITANNATKIYGQTAALTFAETGLVTANNDTITGVMLASNGAGATAAVVGSPYTITPSNAQGSGLGNYFIIYVPGQLTVTARPITITANSGQSQTYGSIDPTQLTYTVGGQGLVNGDTLSGNLATTAANTSPVGSYAINQGLLTANGNYTITSYTGANLAVTARQITITANGGQSQTYGSIDPTQLTYTVGGQGLVNNDTLSGSLATTAANTSPVGSYAINQGSLTANGNYAIASYTGANLAVTARPITITANSGQSQKYGSIDATLLTYTVGARGLVNGDALSGNLATTATNTSPVGSYAINQGSLANGNYTITSYTGANLAVTARPITVTANSGQSQTYGSIDPTLLTYTVGGQGLVNGDTLSGSLATNATNTSPVGSYAINQGSLTANSNYSITSYTGANLAVTARQITITANGGQSQIYGSIDPTLLTYTVGGQGLVNGDTLSGSLATNASNASPVGSYAINQGSLIANGNYAIASYTGAHLAVTARPITVTANGGQSQTYGAIDPTLLTYTVGGQGLVNGDTLSGSLATTAANTSPVGSYAINQGSLTANSNYTITSYTGADLAVTARPITVTANSGQSQTYGSIDPTQLTYTVGGQGLVNNDTLSGSLATTAANTSPVGSYAINQGSLTANSNYTITSYTGADLAVTARPITITANSGQSQTYGSIDPTLLTYAIGGQGLVNGDTLSGSLATTATNTSPVGSYAINQGSLTANGNYAIASYTGANLAVTARPITVTANSGQSQTYGSIDPTQLTYTVGGQGLVNNDTLSGSLATNATDSSNVGSYAVNQGSLANSNYTITSYTGANLTVNPAQLTYTANVAGRTYGATNPAFTGTVTGFVNGQTQQSATTGTLAFNTPATPSSNVGTYAIDGSGLTADNGNYTFVQARDNATALTISPAPLTVTGSKTYDTTVAFATGQLAVAGAQNGETVTLTRGTGTAPSANASSYANSSLSSLAIQVTGGNATASNYALPTTGTLTIGQATITVTGATGVDKTYDGTIALPAGATGFTYTGVYGADAADVAVNAGSAAYDSANAGQRMVDVSGLGLSGSAAGNYMLSATAVVGSGTITPATTVPFTTVPSIGTSIASSASPAQILPEVIGALGAQPGLTACAASSVAAALATQGAVTLFGPSGQGCN